LEIEKIELGEKIQKLEKEIADLEAQLNALRNQVATLQEDKAKLISENQILRQNVTILSSELENLHKEISELQKYPNYWKTVAEIFESQGKYAQALDAYHRVIDSTNASNDDLFYAIKQVARLNKIVPPNLNPELANTYYAIVYIFKHINVKLSDGRTVAYNLTDQEIQDIRKQFDIVSDKVFNLTRGAILMKFDFRLIEIPLTRVTEEGPDKVNWPKGDDPGVIWMFNDFRTSDPRYFNHFMVWEARPPLRPAIPGGASENHVGVVYYPKDPAGWWTREFFVEVIIHEWLHCVDCMMVRIGYPDELVPNPDGGRDEGYTGNEPFVDPDYRRPIGETTWYGYYRHIMQEHITPRMWRRLVTEYARP